MSDEARSAYFAKVERDEDNRIHNNIESLKERVTTLDGRLRDYTGTFEAHMKAPGRHLGYEDDTTNDDRIAALETENRRLADAVRVIGSMALQQSPLTRQPNKYKTLWINDQKYTIAELRTLFGLDTPS